MIRWMLIVAVVAAITLANQLRLSPSGKGTAQLTAKEDACEAARPFLKILDSFYSTVTFQTSLQQIKERAKTNNVREHLVSFGMDAAGELVVSDIRVGNTNNTAVPLVPGSFADLHNHPKNTPPSSGDVYGLLRLNKRISSYRYRFVVTATNILYALVITDTSAARRFESNYPSQQVKGYSPLFPDSLLNEYREMLQLYNTPEELVMAYMLGKYTAGILLLKQDGSGHFNLVLTQLAAPDNEKKLVAIACN